MQAIFYILGCHRDWMDRLEKYSSQEHILSDE